MTPSDRAKVLEALLPRADDRISTEVKHFALTQEAIAIMRREIENKA